MDPLAGLPPVLMLRVPLDYVPNSLGERALVRDRFYPKFLS